MDDSFEGTDSDIEEAESDIVRHTISTLRFNNPTYDHYFREIELKVNPSEKSIEKEIKIDPFTSAQIKCLNEKQTKHKFIHDPNIFSKVHKSPQEEIKNPFQRKVDLSNQRLYPLRNEPFLDLPDLEIDLDE